MNLSILRDCLTENADIRLVGEEWASELYAEIVGCPRALMCNRAWFVSKVSYAQ